MAEISDNIIIVIIIITVKVDVSTNLVFRRLLDELHQEYAWLVSIANTKNTIIAFGFIFWKTKIMK